MKGSPVIERPAVQPKIEQVKPAVSVPDVAAQARAVRHQEHTEGLAHAAVVAAETGESHDVIQAMAAGSTEGKNEGADPSQEVVTDGGKSLVKEAHEAHLADPEKAKHLFVLDADQKQEATDYLSDLRDPAKVGKDAYGKSLVNGCHHKGEHIDEAEHAQDDAFDGLKDKADKGLLDPAAIGTEMTSVLGVSQEITDPPATYEDVIPRVSQELKGYVERGLISEKEAETIRAEAEKVSGYYREAFPAADPTKVLEMARDHSRIIAYQARMDKNVLVGSDHGVRHILNGNMKFADQLITSLESQGIPVSAQDKLAVHAIIAVHDIGYTTGAAQAPAGFEASKDHPLVSAAFVEANKGYYEGMFGAAAYPVIREGVLDHSYVRADFESQAPEGSDINPRLIRSITSAVDSLGVTAETKVPSFFNNPDSVRELLKIRMGNRLLGSENPDDQQRLTQLMTVRKEALRKIAASASSAEDQKAYLSAVESVNSRTADVLGQFTGEVTDVSLTRADNGTLLPEVHMEMIDEVGTRMRDLFGGDAELAQFVKAMEDLGISRDQMDKFGAVTEEARKNGTTPSSEDLRYSSEKGIVQVSSREKASDEFADFVPVFNEARAINVKSGVVESLSQIDTDPAAFQDRVGDIAASITYLSDTDNVHAEEWVTLAEQLAQGGDVQRQAATRLKELFSSDVNAYLFE